MNTKKRGIYVKFVLNVGYITFLKFNNTAHMCLHGKKKIF